MGLGEGSVKQNEGAELGEEKPPADSSTRPSIPASSVSPAPNVMLCPGCSPTKVRLRMGTGAHSVGCPRGHQFKLCADTREGKTQWLEVVASPTPSCKPGQRFRVPAGAVIG